MLVKDLVQLLQFESIALTSSFHMKGIRVFSLAENQTLARIETNMSVNTNPKIN